MADTHSPERTRREHGHEEPTKNDFSALIKHVQTHPWRYLGAVGFVVLILIITGAYRLSEQSNYQAAAEKYARAMDIEDATERAAALAAIAAKDSPLSARALYMQGETMLEAGDYAGARNAFSRLREAHPDFEFVPEAVEGIGLIEEEGGNFSAARALYEEVTSKWPDSTAAQRQPFNIARCLEGEGNLALAIERYQDQLAVFPGSTIAVRAQTRLDELRAEHPELFPEAEAVDMQELKAAPEAAISGSSAEPTPESTIADITEPGAESGTPVEQPAESPPSTPE